VEPHVAAADASRIALANLPYPATREASVALAEEAIAAAADAGAVLVALPECYVPGYRVPGTSPPAPDAVFLEDAWSRLRRACAEAKIVAAVGTERLVDDAWRIAVIVIDADGHVAGFQDKVQLDPTEESIYAPGHGRRLFTAGALTFGVAICHEGFRYPETVRWAARRGAQLVLLPHYSWHEPGAYVPATYADPKNTFHEKAVLCRAAENTCYVASINVASAGSPTTSAVARPDGTLLAYQPYGQEGVLIVDLELGEATGGLARRYRGEDGEG
jgi:predicted amidohydrolase